VASGEVNVHGCAPQVVDTLGGRIHVRWDDRAVATPHGQLVFFAEFLQTTGIFERWVSTCPLADHSGNAPSKTRRARHPDARAAGPGTGATHTSPHCVGTALPHRLWA